jgi:hypothetical protein
LQAKVQPSQSGLTERVPGGLSHHAVSHHHRERQQYAREPGSGGGFGWLNRIHAVTFAIINIQTAAQRTAISARGFAAAWRS